MFSVGEKGLLTIKKACDIFGETGENMVINVAIVDDEQKERRKLRECLEFIGKEKIKFAVSEFSGAEEFLLKYEPVYDVVFMDIQLGATDGIDAAKALRKIDATVIIIFVTNMAQLAVRGYEVDAMDFIVKPVEKLTFALKFKRVLGRLLPRENSKILIKQDGDFISVNPCALRYVEVDGHYVVYHSPDGAVREYTTLSAAEKKISAGGAFVRCNRGQAVNLRFVTAVRRDTVEIDGEELILARTQRNAFIKAYAEYMSGGGR